MHYHTKWQNSTSVSEKYAASIFKAAAHISETLVCIYQLTLCHIPEDCISLNLHHCESFKSHYDCDLLRCDVIYFGWLVPTLWRKLLPSIFYPEDKGQVYCQTLVPVYQTMGNHIHKHHDLNTHCSDTPHLTWHTITPILTHFSEAPPDWRHSTQSQGTRGQKSL